LFCFEEGEFYLKIFVYLKIRVCEVTNDRNGKNDKELSVRAGEFVEVLDDRRNWWRVRNISGAIGHVPNTLMKPFETPNSPHLAYQQQQQQFDTIEKVGYF
jgi:SH3-like domain-containing protein